MDCSSVRCWDRVGEGYVGNFVSENFSAIEAVKKIKRIVERGLRFIFRLAISRFVELTGDARWRQSQCLDVTERRIGEIENKEPRRYCSRLKSEDVN